VQKRNCVLLDREKKEKGGKKERKTIAVTPAKGGIRHEP